MFRVEQLGAPVYGGAVTLSEWWDQKRIDQGTLQKNEILKKMGTWTYGVIGIGATMISGFGWLGRTSYWAEPVSVGFMYDLPRVLTSMVKSMSKNSAGSESNAVSEAQRIARARQMALLTAGQGAQRFTEQTTKPEFENQRTY
jgi:hypothetical protein